MFQKVEKKGFYTKRQKVSIKPVINSFNTYFNGSMRH